VQKEWTIKIREPISNWYTTKGLGNPTRRDLECLILACKFDSRVGGKYLGMSDQTLKNHLTTLYRKLDVCNRSEALMMVIALGLIRVELKIVEEDECQTRIT